jgi:hypothetical protein
VVRVDMGDEAPHTLLLEPSNHRRGCLLCMAPPLACRGDHPSDLCGQPASTPERRLNRADRDPGTTISNHPVQPALRPIGRPAGLQPGVTRA